MPGFRRSAEVSGRAWQHGGNQSAPARSQKIVQFGLEYEKPVENARLDPHGHYDVPVAGAFLVHRPELPGALFVLELKADLPSLAEHAEEVEQVLVIESDLQQLARIFRVEHLMRLPVFAARREQLQPAFFELEADR